MTAQRGTAHNSRLADCGTQLGGDTFDLRSLTGGLHLLALAQAAPQPAKVVGLYPIVATIKLPRAGSRRSAAPQSPHRQRLRSATRAAGVDMLRRVARVVADRYCRGLRLLDAGF